MGRKMERFALIVMLIAMAFSGFAIVAILDSYEPMSFNSIEAEEEVCPNETTAVGVDYYIDPELYDSISEIRVSSDWVAVDVPGISRGSSRDAGELVVRGRDVQPGKNIRQGKALRVAPDVPGLWRLETENEVRSSRPVWPPVQVVEASSVTLTRVLPEDHPDCKD